MSNLRRVRCVALGCLLATVTPQPEALRTNEMLFSRRHGEGTVNEAHSRKPAPNPPAARETLFNLRDRLQAIPHKLPAPDTRQMAASALADVNFMIRGWTASSTVPPEYST